MTEPDRPQPGPNRRAALATGLFARLADSYERGDFKRAAAAQRELRRLGWSIVRCNPRRSAEGGDA